MLESLKKMAIRELKSWVKADLEAQYDSLELAIAALGAGPQAWRDSVVAAAEAAFTTFSTGRTAIQAATNIAELKAAWKTIVQARPDAAEWRASLGAGNEIELD